MQKRGGVKQVDIYGDADQAPSSLNSTKAFFCIGPDFALLSLLLVVLLSYFVKCSSRCEIVHDTWPDSVDRFALRADLRLAVGGDEPTHFPSSRRYRNFSFSSWCARNLHRLGFHPRSRRCLPREQSDRSAALLPRKWPLHDADELRSRCKHVAFFFDRGGFA